ncbi:GntR family transcriptional regulator [Rhizobiaceae bacterium CRRU44]|uniref:GntR family transcriptional regulator n=1 Tax=Ferranicluibacter rubi TaxID=2715133 RepID=A0AA43ZGS2_9HYPH|nr:GntR family transcriptional regulator [Ferranicluibacter rubi]NHT76811.1 GntR family transcriptional regulator [Ferranicluibacter rubi]
MSQPLAKKAYGTIIDMILSGALMPGDVLQEAKLGEEFSMSRTPVREAIKRIEAEGLAVQEGRFLKVRRLAAEEVEEIFYLRSVIEGYCARIAIAAPAYVFDDLERRIRVLIATGPGENGEALEVDDDFHFWLANVSGNRTMMRTIGDLRRRTCMFDHSLVPERFLKGCREHLEILDALRAGDADAAGSLMSRHVLNARDAILEKLDASSGGLPR